MEQEINYIVHKLLIASITKNRWSKIVFENVRKASVSSFSRKAIPFSESRPPSSPRFRREASTRFRVVHTTEIEIYISTNSEWSELARGAKSFGNIGSNFEKFVSIRFFFLFLFFFLCVRCVDTNGFHFRRERKKEEKENISSLTFEYEWMSKAREISIWAWKLKNCISFQEEETESYLLLPSSKLKLRGIDEKFYFRELDQANDILNTQVEDSVQFDLIFLPITIEISTDTFLNIWSAWSRIPKYPILYNRNCIPPNFYPAFNAPPSPLPQSNFFPSKESGMKYRRELDSFAKFFLGA